MTASFKKKRFAFLMYPEYEELDLIGPWEMATMWRDYADGPACFTLSQTGAPMTCAKGLKTAPDHGFADAPAFDYLLVPGGFAALREAENDAMNAFLKESAARTDAMLSVCTGSLMFEAAGLLHGRKATTHWKLLDGLRRKPGVEVVEERYVKDGPVWTSAGVSAGIDMTLAFIADVAGAEAAGVVQHNAEYYPDGRLYGAAARSETSPRYVREIVRAR